MLNSWYFSISGPADHTLLPIDQPNRPWSFKINIRNRVTSQQATQAKLSLLPGQFLLSCVEIRRAVGSTLPASLLVKSDLVAISACPADKFKVKAVPKLKRYHMFSFQSFQSIQIHLDFPESALF